MLILDMIFLYFLDFDIFIFLIKFHAHIFEKYRMQNAVISPSTSMMLTTPMSTWVVGRRLSLWGELTFAIDVFEFRCASGILAPPPTASKIELTVMLSTLYFVSIFRLMMNNALLPLFDAVFGTYLPLRALLISMAFISYHSLTFKKIWLIFDIYYYVHVKFHAASLASVLPLDLDDAFSSTTRILSWLMSQVVKRACISRHKVIADTAPSKMPCNLKCHFSNVNETKNTPARQ